MNAENVKDTVLKVVKENPGIRVEDVAEKVEASKYEVFKAVKALVAEGSIKAVEGEGFDVYRPSWTKSLYVVELEDEKSEEKFETEEQAKYELEKPSVNLVLTHPRPTQTAISYLTFQECFELLAAEGEVVGVVGFVDAHALRQFVCSVLQRVRRSFTLRLVCTDVKYAEALPGTVEFLRGIGADVRIKRLSGSTYGERAHAKFLTAGVLSYVGSHNILPASMSSNLEVGLLVGDRALSDQLRKVFAEAWESGVEV